MSWPARVIRPADFDRPHFSLRPVSLDCMLQFPLLWLVRVGVGAGFVGLPFVGVVLEDELVENIAATDGCSLELEVYLIFNINSTSKQDKS